MAFGAAALTSPHRQRSPHALLFSPNRLKSKPLAAQLETPAERTASNACPAMRCRFHEFREATNKLVTKRRPATARLDSTPHQILIQLLPHRPRLEA